MAEIPTNASFVSEILISPVRNCVKTMTLPEMECTVQFLCKEQTVDALSLCTSTDK